MNQASTKVYRKPTIKDVAEHANVSKSAVSHFINGRVNICSEETGLRIRSAINELNFVPARSILHQQARSTQTIGVCVSLPPRHKADFNYTHLHDFWSGLASVTDEFDYKLLHFPGAIRNGADCSAFLDGSIDGLLLSGGRSDNRFETLAKAGLPTVAAARWSNLPPEVGSVWSDDPQGVELALEHLWSLGHRRIAHIAAADIKALQSGERDSFVADAAVARHDYFLSWMSRRGVDQNDLVVSHDGWSEMPFEQARQALVWLRERTDPITAVLCANDAIAASLLSAASLLDIRVPDDLSVVGMDNNVNCALMNPPLTSVELPFWEIGRGALLLLHRMMRSEPLTDRRVVIPVTRLVVRESTGPI